MPRCWRKFVRALGAAEPSEPTRVARIAGKRFWGRGARCSKRARNVFEVRRRFSRDYLISHVFGAWCSKLLFSVRARVVEIWVCLRLRILVLEGARRGSKVLQIRRRLRAVQVNFVFRRAEQRSSPVVCRKSTESAQTHESLIAGPCFAVWCQRLPWFCHRSGQKAKCERVKPKQRQPTACVNQRRRKTPGCQRVCFKLRGVSSTERT